VPFAFAPASAERVYSMRLVVIGAVIAVLGFVMSLSGFAWGLGGGEWWPGPTLLNGFGWLVLGVGVALAVVGLVRRSRNRARA
jgi:hypothetical protein